MAAVGVSSVPSVLVPVGLGASWNANRVKPSVLAKVRRSLEEFGVVENLVARPLADGTLEVVSGNHRLQILRELGVSEAPVVVVDLSDGDARVLAQTLNRTRGEDDPEAYAALLDEVLGSVGVDRALEFLPETAASIDRVLAGFAPPLVEGEFAVPTSSPKSKAGEVYELGRHRVMCGDATDDGDVARLLAGISEVDCVWTDPPYGVSYVGSGRAAAEGTEREKIDGDVEGDALGDLLESSLGLAFQYTREGGAWYVAAPPGPSAFYFETVLRDLGVWRQTLVWVKDHFVIGRSDYHGRHETIYYGWKPGKAHFFEGGRVQDTVWEFPRPYRSEEHPTMKPVELIELALRNSTDTGGTVLDLFAGSGSTLLAAERTARTAFVMEKDPGYCDVIRDRYQALVVSAEG